MNKMATEDAVKELYNSLPLPNISLKDFQEKLLKFLSHDNASINLNDCKSSDADRSPHANSSNETNDYSFSEGIK